MNGEDHDRLERSGPAWSPRRSVRPAPSSALRPPPCAARRWSARWRCPRRCRPRGTRCPGCTAWRSATVARTLGRRRRYLDLVAAAHAEALGVGGGQLGALLGREEAQRRARARSRVPAHSDGDGAELAGPRAARAALSSAASGSSAAGRLGRGVAVLPAHAAAADLLERRGRRRTAPPAVSRARDHRAPSRTSSAGAAAVAPARPARSSRAAPRPGGRSPGARAARRPSGWVSVPSFSA